MHLLRVLQKLLALVDKLGHNDTLGLQLVEGLLLPLNQLLDILNARRSNVTSGAEHDAIQELNVGLELVTIGVALPVEIDLDLGLEDSGNEIFMLLDESLKLGVLSRPLLLGPLGHQDLEDLLEPFLDVGALKVLAESLKIGEKNCLSVHAF